jgi:hypothetical protein
MTLDDFYSKAFADHATDAAGVMARLPDGIALVSSPADLPKLAHLIAHVAGEHLGRWSDGIALLERLRAHAMSDASTPEGKAILRSLAVLHSCAGDLDAAERFTLQSRIGGDVPEASDRARIQALIASSLAGQKRTAEAAKALDEALRLAGYGPGPKDPAARALAVAGNNLASDLELRETLADDERALMLKAAQVARDFWGIAGGWMEAERAEYRLAMSCIKAGLADRAAGHARECLRIVRENGSDAGELFFAHEAGARACVAAADGAGAAASTREAEAALTSITDDGFRDYCAGELEKLRSLISADPLARA